MTPTGLGRIRYALRRRVQGAALRFQCAAGVLPGRDAAEEFPGRVNRRRQAVGLDEQEPGRGVRRLPIGRRENF